MSTSKINEQVNKPFSVFSYGFRPFFLAAGIYAILSLVPWMLYLFDFIQPKITMYVWHAHEMLFGFVAAAISGFLLTAIPKWTNTPPLSGTGLKLFFIYWIVGRIAFWLILFFDHPIFTNLLFLDLILPVLQGLRISRIIIKSKNYRNLIIVAIIGTLALANFLIILELNQVIDGIGKIGSILAPNIIMLMIAIIGGRITKNFTQNYYNKAGIQYTVKTFSLIEFLAISLLVFQVAADILFQNSHLSSSVTLFAAVIHTVRWSLWRGLHTRKNPLLCVLHVAYFALIVALFLKSAEHWFSLPNHIYIHVFALGAAGLFIMAVMSRATLGHTARELKANTTTVIAYVLIILAAFTRTGTEFLDPAYFNTGMALTTVLWSTGFIFFVFVYGPMLVRPRIDGLPG